ncbi:hypothetical protein [Hydrogenibacillus sp. N12]|uniref:hypothetical protein n=1 Tax=Hydrogenibacillus sp. N12 TaxID=2866627 RepID=UPI001C7D186B|nr:hypothetical protein [Hydrogenibacillus sp. N12]QZA32589.1 hypothetical protein K2M58_09890 [Hydrogenibacillus sp. N12]
MSVEIWVYRLYDVAQEIDLDAIEARLRGERTASRLTLRLGHPKGLEIKNPPLSFVLDPDARISLSGEETPAEVSARFYDFGVLSLVIRLRLSTSLDWGRLMRYAEALQAEETPELDRRFEAYRDDVLRRFGTYFYGGGYADYVEDFVLFAVRAWPDDEEWSPLPILLGEKGPLSEALVEDALRYRFSYDEDDIIIAWDSAWVEDADGPGAVADLLEFAKAQLLELRYYDDLLERELAALYDMLAAAHGHRGRFRFGRLRESRKLMRKIMELILEITEFTGRIENALKVTHDFYYARIYTAAVERFRMREWSESIREKMSVLERHYQLLADESLSTRFIWIDTLILLLILIEILLGLLRLTG